MPADWMRLVPDAAFIVLIWLVGAAFFFRAEWSSGFRLGAGDSHDTVQLTALMEHWYHVLLGEASWRNPAIFYPLKGVLGWSDGLVLFQVFYAPLRALGLDMFLAAEVSVILFSLVGFASFVCLTRVAFGARRWVALAGGLAFTFANNLWLHLYWIQLLTVWMVPGILLIGLLAFRCWSGHPLRSLLLGIACGLLAAQAFFTDFYVAWFSTLAGGIAFVILLIAGRLRWVPRLLGGLRETWQLVLTIGVAFVVGLVPFLMTYLPTESSLPKLGYAGVMRYAPRPRDVINVGPGNVLWTSVVHHVVPVSDRDFSALNYAVTPLLMVLAVVGSALAMWMTRRERARGGPFTAQAAAVLAATAVVMSILPLRTDIGSLWSVVWHIPGAGVIRRTNRVGVVTGLVASLSVVCAVSVVYGVRGRQPWQSLRRAAVVALLLLAVAEQVNTTDMSRLNRPKELAFLRSTPPPPRQCRSFYVLDTQNSALSPGTAAGDSEAVTDQIDAILISEKYLIPTVNGYTSYSPPGWGLLDPFWPGYLDAVRSWAEDHHLERGLCQLDLSAMQWRSNTLTAPHSG
jgi:hypothetical protein